MLFRDIAREYSRSPRLAGARPPREKLVLGRSARIQALLDLRGALCDLGEADHGDGVVGVDRPAVDLLEEVGLLVRPAELRVVVLDVAGREVADALDLDRVDDRLEDALARR